MEPDGTKEHAPARLPLDPRLRWGPRWQYDPGRSALFLEGEVIASLHQKIDTGAWFARLHPSLVPMAPDLYRDCRGEDMGRRGCEAWAMRHLDHLLGEVAAAKARRPGWMGGRGGRARPAGEPE